MAYNFDNFVSDAKNVFDKVASKANDAVDYSKAQIDKAQIRAKIREKYEELGKAYYEIYESDSDKVGSMKPIIAEIKKLKIKLEDADSSVKQSKYKACAFCEIVNDGASIYCKKCGEKL